MKFDNVAEFLAMSGHGPYVWSAYAITAVVLAANVVWPMMQARRRLRTLREDAGRSQESME